MNTTWKVKKLQELTEADRPITYGVVKPGDHDPDGIIFVRGGDVVNGRVKISELRTITRDVSNQYKRTLLRGGELLVSLVGNPGEAAIAPKSLKGANIARQVGLVALQPSVDRLYVMYFLLSADGRRELFSQTTGSVQKVINLANLKNVRVPCPPLSTQRKIASILSAYDDLIENNTRRIAILEEMAQVIYREWFVHFRFPGHENVKLVDSLLGQIPEGWEVGMVNDLLTLKSGFAFKSKTFVDSGNYKVVTIKNVHDGVFDTSALSLLDHTPDRMPDHCRLKTGDILMSLTGNIGRTCLVYGENYLLNQRVAKLQPLRDVDFSIVYTMFRRVDTRHRLEQIANGVAQQNLSPVQTGKLEIALPPLSLRIAFGEKTTPMLTEIILLNRKNAKLRITRDLLLPKLISGKLDVEDLDIDTGELAEKLEEATA